MADLIIKISGDAADYEAALELVSEQTESLSSQMGDITKAAGIAFAALTAEIGLSVKSFAEAEAAQNKLTLAMQNQGIFSYSLLDSYKKRADALQTLTGVDNDLILTATATIQALIGQREVTEDLQLAVLNLASVNDLGVEAATQYITQGINGQTRGLKTLGIVIDEHLTKQERIAQITAKVNTLYKDSAASANNNSLSMKGLASAFDDLQTAIGERFAPLVSAAIKGMKELTTALADNSGFATFASAILAAGAFVTGFVTVLGGLGKALITARELALAFGLAQGALLGPLGIAAAALAAIGLGVGVFATQAKSATTSISGLNKEITDLKNRISAVQAQIDKKEALFQNTNREIAQLKELNQTLADTEAQLKKVSEAGAGQDPGKKAAATAVAEAAARTIREQAAEKQLQFETDQMAIRAEMANAEGAAILEKQIQLQDLQFQNATTHADKMQALRNKAALTQALTVAKAAENEKKLEDDKNKDMVANRTAFLSQMATLQSSGNQTLIAIGRAAAIASITIATADAAMKSYAFGAALGGPFLGGTFQALAIAAGAIQAAKVAGVSMADGGLVTGGIAGVDSVPAMLMPGEFVAPARDADAIIDAAARDRAGEGGAAHVVIELKDGLMDFIEAKLVERQRLGISIQGA